MVRLLLALVLVAGCVQEPPQEPGDGTPPPGWGLDDDDAGPPVPLHGLPPDRGDVPFDPGDASGLAPCELEEVAGEGCDGVEHRVFEASMAGCADGTFRFDDAVSWAGFLLDCGHDGGDPAAEVDWATEALIVHSDRGEGCSLSHETLWLADCADGPVLGLWFYLCGECTDLYAGQLMVPVPADWPAVEVVECVPLRIRCST